MARTKVKQSRQPKFPIVLKNYFNNWAKSRNITSIKNYRAWLNQLPNYLNNNLTLFPKNIQNEIKSIKFLGNYLNLINDFIIAGDGLYALSVYDKVYEVLKLSMPYLNLSNCHSAMIALGVFLNEHDFSNDFFKNLSNSIGFVGLPQRSVITSPSVLHKIDGMSSLIFQLGGHNGFIKSAIRESYFFDPNLVAYCSLSSPYQARHTTDYTININKASKGMINVPYVITDINPPFNNNVNIDPRNNTAVHNIIKKLTGVTVSNGKKCLMQNYNISHIWGRAWDPRYFTSLWNIVLIPSWANSLMDKINPPVGSLASKMIATYMAICYNLYCKCLTMSNYGLSVFPSISNSNDIMHGTYIINLIGAKHGNSIIISFASVTV